MGDRYQRGREDSRPPPRRDPPPRRSNSRDRGPAPPPRRSDSRDRGPPPRGGGDRGPPERDRGPPERGGKGGYGSGGKPEQGKYKITIEGIPEDMSWKELKDLGRESGRTLTFARTYKSGNRNYGMIEFSKREDADSAVRDLDNRRVQGSKDRLKASMGDLAADGSLGQYRGHGRYDADRSAPRQDDRGPPRRRSRTPPRRSPPRRGGNRQDEEIMTLFVKDLPDDCREQECEDDIGRSAKALRVMLMNKNNQCSAFVRFESVKEAERAMEDMNDGVCKVAGKRVSAEMARRNTDV